MPNTDRILDQLLRVCLPIGLGTVAYCVGYWLLGGRELGMLVGGKENADE
jgi:hypothetical protein